MAGCSAHRAEIVRFVAPDFYASAPARVAVLPFANESVDLVGPDMLRRMVVNRLKSHGYDPLNADHVDNVLRELGITDGGQLGSVAPEALGRALGVEGLLYGTVEEFTMQNLGFVARRVVRLRLRFIRSGGERLWEDTGQGVTGSVTFNKKEAGRKFLEGIVIKGVENLFRTPLQPESNQAVQDLFSRLPVKQ